MRILALLPLLFGPHCLAEALNGRLFFTPEERRLIDQKAQADRPPGRLDGLVSGPDGQQTTWIDGKVRGGQAARLAVGDSPRQPLLPPGSLHIEAGTARR